MRVAINGAGVAGPTLAFWLASAGHAVTILERAPQLRTGGYIIDFWGHGYTIAERIGILPAVRGRGYQVEQVHIVDRRGHVIGGFGVDVFDSPTGGRFTSVLRGDLASTIFDALPADVETLFDDGIVELRQDDDGVDVRFASGGERRFDLVVGADGLHSAVRALAFAPEDRFEHQLGFRVAAFDIDGYRPRDELTYVIYNEPGMQVSRFALRGDRTTVLLVFRAELATGDEPRDAAECKARLHQVFDEAGWETSRILAAMDRLDDVYYDRVSQIRMEHWTRGRVALIGDAASCVSLLAGEGTGLAMTQAYVLAGELERAGGDHRIAFGAYEERLRAFLIRKQASAAKFAGAFAPATRIGLAFRNLVSKALRFGPVAEYFIGRGIVDDVELPAYAIGNDA